MTYYTDEDKAWFDMVEGWEILGHPDMELPINEETV